MGCRSPSISDHLTASSRRTTPFSRWPATHTAPCRTCTPPAGWPTRMAGYCLLSSKFSGKKTLAAIFRPVALGKRRFSWDGSCVGRPLRMGGIPAKSTPTLSGCVRGIYRTGTSLFQFAPGSLPPLSQAESPPPWRARPSPCCPALMPADQPSPSCSCRKVSDGTKKAVPVTARL